MRLGEKGFRSSAALPLKSNTHSVRRSVLAGACLLLALLFARAADATVLGHQGHSYAVGSATKSIKNPTLSGPESKLWYKGGRWWGVLWDTASGSHHIFWLNALT